MAPTTHTFTQISTEMPPIKCAMYKRRINSTQKPTANNKKQQQQQIKGTTI